jgi:predicted ATPase
MLTELRATNFKSWADTGQIRIAPFTGFFGANSSGKTALLQILLLLKQTVESPDRSRILNTGGDENSYVDFGTVYDIINYNNNNDELQLAVSWKPSQPAITFGDFHLPEELNFATTIEASKANVSVNFFSYNAFKGEEDLWKVECKKTSRKSRNYDISLTTPKGMFKRKAKSVKFFFYALEDNGIEFLEYGLSTVTFLTNLFSRMYYVGPLRDYPRRTYLFTGETPHDVGKKGEYAVAALLAKPEIQKAVAKHLKDMKLIHDFKLAPLARGRREHELLVQQHAHSKLVPITDLGFGVSQVLPVITLCHYVPENSIILLEQPEIHLHPAVQANLADVLIDVIKTRGLQIIIESHSEHFLNRLQRRIAEESIGSDQVALYFCESDEQGVSHLKTLELDNFGNIKNWPPNFFGDELDDLVAMADAQMEREMKQMRVG